MAPISLLCFRVSCRTASSYIVLQSVSPVLLISECFPGDFQQLLLTVTRLPAPIGPRGPDDPPGP
jgi:hypothetical protein